MSRKPPEKGRGATFRPHPRFLTSETVPVDDGWGSLDAPAAPVKTTVTAEVTRSSLSRNQSPDVPFSVSLNPYKGCEHGCVYCFARPTHAYLDLSPGLDFESRLFSKPGAPDALDRELRRKSYRPSVIALGANTDAYQPVERDLKIARAVLAKMLGFRHPVSIITKSSLVLRDLDLLAPLAAENLVSVFVSVTTLDPDLARRMEPRAAAPHRRLETIAHLADAGVPVGLLASPMIPALNDGELEAIMESARDAGARSANYILVRLPFEIKDLIEGWLDEHYPLKKQRVLNLIRDMRGGKLYDSQWGERMRGTGPLADLLNRRFEVARRRLGYEPRLPDLECDKFRVPPAPGDQLRLL